MGAVSPTSRRARLPFVVAAALLGCDETRLLPSEVDAGPRRCLSDDDCPDRASCNVSTGVCYELDACGPDRPCPNGQVCRPGEDGYRVCAFERCTSDEACASEVDCGPELVPSCQAGACMCGTPCSGGCPPGEGCCIADDTCYPLPERCMGMRCPLGQQLSVTATGAWSRRSCMIEGEACVCERLPPLAEGDIGLYASMVQPRRGPPLVAAYNRTWGDLMVGEVQADQTVRWSFVDGVPTSTQSIGGDIDGPRGGQAGPGRDVGWFSSATLAGDGETLFVAYQDRDAGSLRFALGEAGRFSHHEVDADGEAGLFAHAGLGAGDRPFVVYLARAAGPVDARRSSLRLAVAATTRPASANDWTIRDLVDTALAREPCVERCLEAEVCVLPAERCETPDAPGSCAPSCERDAACVRGRCRPVAAGPLVRELPRAAGLWPDAALAPNGELEVAYYDSREGSLVLLRIAEGGTGAIRAASIAGGPGGRVDTGSDAGRFVRLAVDPSGVTHLAYLDRTRAAVRYAQVSASGAILSAETVERGIAGGPRLLGGDIALLLTPEGPLVAYQDGSEASVRLAARDPDGSWSVRPVAGGAGRGGQGFYIDLLPRPGGGARGVSYRFDLMTSGDANGVAFFEHR